MSKRTWKQINQYAKVWKVNAKIYSKGKICLLFFAIYEFNVS